MLIVNSFDVFRIKALAICANRNGERASKFDLYNISTSLLLCRRSRDKMPVL
jgi:hypothetical protein